MSDIAKGGANKPSDPLFHPFSLKKSFGKRYRILMEESWQYETAENKKGYEGYYEIIPCQGFKKPPEQEGPYISLSCEDPPSLQLYTNRPINAKNIWKEIKKTSGCRADFALDGEAILFFPPEVLALVAEMAGARKRRVLTEEQRDNLIEAGKSGRDALRKWREQRAQGHDSTQNEAISTQAGCDGQPGGGEVTVSIEFRSAVNGTPATEPYRGATDYQRR
jgi:hypothetical protein